MSKVNCPGCGIVVVVQKKHLGKNLKCKCGKRFKCLGDPAETPVMPKWLPKTVSRKTISIGACAFVLLVSRLFFFSRTPPAQEQPAPYKNASLYVPMAHKTSNGGSRAKIPADENFAEIIAVVEKRAGEKNVNKLEKLYRTAEQGDTDAQFNLGVMYANGEGVEKNPREAVIWYRKAAAQGNALAQYNLGVMYANGEGVEKNPREAIIWYRKAAAQGNALAQYNLGVMYYKGEGVEKDLKEVVKWYRKAAAQRVVFAQSKLGAMYDNGIGVEKDSQEAFKWYRKAAAQG